MTDLPAPVAEAGLLLHRASIVGDPEALKKITVWGHAQIDIAYPEDPIRAPLNIFRRKFAHMEWDRVIRTAGKELRGTIVSSIVQDLEHEILRRRGQQVADDAEADRQRGAHFDTEMRVKEQAALAEINDRIARVQMQLAHDLNEVAEDNASARRIKERIAESETQIAVITAEAVVKAMGSSSAEQTIKAVRMVNAEIASIRNDSTLTDDDKHLQIKTFLETLPTVLRGARSSDV